MSIQEFRERATES